jgi:uncharacterized protein YdhG (YjbR/CyaY superfamily)
MRREVHVDGVGWRNGSDGDDQPNRRIPRRPRRTQADYADILEGHHMAIVPDAEQCISYGLPAFRLRGKTIAGFAAFKNHLSSLPHSGSVIPQLAKETAPYTSIRGSLHFPVDEPLPEALAQKLLELSPGRFLVDVRQSPGYSLGRPVPAQQAGPAHRPKPASGPKNPVRTAGVRCTMAW